ARAMAASATKDPHGSVFERDPDELLAMVGDRRGPERLLDIMLRTGPYGDGFGTDPDGLTLGVLEANPHGVDLGPLEGGRIPDLLRTPTGLVDLAPEMLRADLARLDGAVTTPAEDELVLIGRRHVRSNNSWMHNVRVLMKGRNRCTLMIHPTDAERLGVAHGERARVASRVGAVEVVAEVTDAVRPGVVSLPHGFGQRLPGVRLSIATEYEGVNTNLLTDESFLDPISGNVALNGVPVEVAAVGV
ncbi:MAG: molybdopterin dinucleotide binding domain-containing protein, partial [Ilumatobacteraceae bacterium]